VSDQTTAIACAIHDSVMVLAPRGFQKVTLRFVGETQLRLDALETAGEGSDAPKTKPNLRIDQTAEAFRLGEGVTVLKDVLAGAGKHWHGQRAELVRETSFTDLRLFQNDNALCSFIRISDDVRQSLLMTEPLFELLDDAAKPFDRLQKQFEADLPTARAFAYDAEAGVLQVKTATGQTLNFEALVLGQFLRGDAVWSWAWADGAASSVSVASVERVCAPAKMAPGLAALWRPHYQCDEGFIFTLCGSVCVALAAKGLFYMPVADGSAAVFFAVLQSAS
jgi:hypothetical protein